MSKQVFVPLQSVVVQREGKDVVPPTGQPFEFTADEIKDIRSAEKESNTTILREAVNEEAALGEAKAKAMKKHAELVAKAEAAEEAAAKQPKNTALAEAATKSRKAATDFAAEHELGGESL